MKKKKVLIFIAHYLPGYKIGGPLNSVIHIVDNLSFKFEFYIVTSDRDLGDDAPYKNITRNQWVDVRGTKVLYIRHGAWGFRDILNAIHSDNFDSIYLNSYFQAKFSIFIVILRYLKLITVHQLILAPRGEFYTEALGFKKTKKFLYLQLTKVFKIYDNVVWHSTNTSESEEIRKLFSASASIREARVLSDTVNKVESTSGPVFEFGENTLKLIFLSRISKDKNILFIFDVLVKIRRPLEFHIYGPIEDADIWSECLMRMNEMPDNIRVKYNGPVDREDVKAILSQYDVFFLPIHRENFGHVISESLSVGTPVLISSNTPWRNLLADRLGWDLDLANEGDFVEVIECYAELSNEFRMFKRNQVIEGFNKRNNVSGTIDENIALFS